MEECNNNEEEFCIVINEEQTNVIEDIIVEMEETIVEDIIEMEETIVEDIIEIEEMIVEEIEPDVVMEKKEEKEEQEEQEEKTEIANSFEEEKEEEETIVVLGGNIVNTEEEKDEHIDIVEDVEEDNTNVEKDTTVEDIASDIQPKEKFNFLNFMKNLFKK